MIRHSGNLATAVLAALVVLAPLPFGSVQPWALGVIEVAAFLTLLLAVLSSRYSEAAPGRPIWIAAGAVAGVAALGVLQSVAWPAWLGRMVSSLHVENAEAAAALTGQGADAVALSLSPWASRWSALAWLAMAALFLASAIVGHRRNARRWLFGALMVAALFEIFYGARRWALGSAEIWGVAVPGDQARLGGTFVNPNHLATFLMIAMAAVGAVGWWSLRRAQRELLLERRLWLIVAPIALWVLLFVGIAFTGSRAGMVAAVLGTLAQGALVASAQRSWRPALGLGALALAGVGAVAWIGGRAGFGRWLVRSPDQLSGGARFEVYEAGLELWSRFPLFGSGLGTFRDAFPAVQPSSTPGNWWHAHNDWLELAITTGLVGLALVLVAGVAVLSVLRRIWTGGARSEDRAAALAAYGALVAVALHELVEFGLTIPANAAVFAIALGVSLGAATQVLRAAEPPPE